MLKFRIIYILLFAPILLFSQMKVEGTIVNEQNSPMAYASVILEKGEDMIKSTSNKDGKFQLKASEGDYILKISYFGEVIYEKGIQLVGNLDLGLIKPQKVREIKGVVIARKKKLFERKSDRLVFNVQNSVLATGGNALDILSITPRIKVQNDKISMIGKESMRVMVDDRMLHLLGSDLSNFLKSLNSDEIKSIEVIANPPSKYSAEGNSGIINIVTKKQKKNSWSSSIRSVYQQATYPMGLIGWSGDYRRKKLSLYSSISYVNGSNAPDLMSDIDYSEIYWKQQTDRRSFTNSFSSRMGLDYEISDKLKTGFVYQYRSNHPKIEDNTVTAIFNKQTSQTDSLIINNSVNRQKKTTNLLNYHLIYDIDTIGRKLSFDFDYLDFKSGDKLFFNQNTYDSSLSLVDNSDSSVENRGGQRIKNYSFNLDMEHPFKKIHLNYGGRISQTNTKSDFQYYDVINDEYVYDDSKSNEFEYTESTQAIYFSAKKNITDKLETKVGLRLENTQIEGNSVTLNQKNKSHYTKLFPTAYISYYPNDNHSFSLSYNKRINRPSYRLLNPFRWISSQYSYAEGNPYLNLLLRII